jgi:hypothetical protein
MKKVSPYALGASLYMPATRPDLLAVVSGEKLPAFTLFGDLFRRCR